MKFNEKLIELRKREGLSQEDLGYKLNVTRQTVSKWELGITTPEMEKLIEISKLFNISVDDLIKEDSTIYNTYESNPINNSYGDVEGVITGNSSNTEEEPKKKRTGLIVCIIIGVLLIIGIPLFLIASLFSNIFSGVFGIFDTAQDIFNTSTGIINEIAGSIDGEGNIISGATEFGENVVNEIEEGKSQMKIDRFNGPIEILMGSRNGTIVKKIIDEVTTSNQKEDRKITVKYMETETQDVTEIRNLKKEIDDMDDFETYCDYDEDGYIYKVTIEKVGSAPTDEEMMNEMADRLEDLKNMMNIDI